MFTNTIKKQSKIYLVVIACALCLLPNLFSQNQMVAVQTSKINIAKSQQFITAHKKSNEVIKEKTTTPVYYEAYVTQDNRLILVSPIDSFADLDKMAPAIGANSQLVDPAINQQIAETIEWQESAISVRRNDLSVLPAKGRDLSDLNFVRWHTFHYHPKDGGKMFAVAKKIKTYWDSQDSDYFYLLFQPYFDRNVNRIIVVEFAKDLAGMAALDDHKSTQLKNPEYAALMKELRSIVTDVEVVYGRYNAELSFLRD